MKFCLVGVLLMVAIAVAGAQSPKPGFSFKNLNWQKLFGAVQKILAKVDSLLASASEAAVEKGKPKFCGKYECPPFKTLNKTKMYEVRCYGSANWVSTKGFGNPKPMGTTTNKMFMKLFKYIGGANKEETKIEMTVPVLTSIKGPGDEKSLKMSFYVPSKFQKNVPVPTDSAVKVEKTKFCAYVHSFKSTIFKTDFSKQVGMLRRQLEVEGLKYDASYYVTAGYDSPYKLFNRYNEVMVMKL